MKISKNGLELIKSFEGLRLSAYKVMESELNWTIGYGHCGSDVKAGMTITEEQAEEYLRKDVERAESKVNAENAQYNWNQNEFDAMVSFAYNIGSISQLTNLGKRTKSEIADKMLLYVKAGGKVLKGLERRRKAEQELFLTPVNKVEATDENIRQPIHMNLRCVCPYCNCPISFNIERGE